LSLSDKRAQTLTDGAPRAVSLAPNWAVLLCGTSAVALVSFIFLPWLAALASSVLGFLMIAGADVDARTFLLPDLVTYGALIAGLLAAPFLADAGLWPSLEGAALRAAGVGLFFVLLRTAHLRLRGREGLGLGDVKLAAAAGAWLPLAVIPYCFGLASVAALISVIFLRRGEALENVKLPFGAFLCPALWLVFFLNLLFA
jgi:leader peptidase (prepilin peptidase) / N-methyltransferase